MNNLEVFAAISNAINRIELDESISSKKYVGYRLRKKERGQLARHVFSYLEIQGVSVRVQGNWMSHSIDIGLKKSVVRIPITNMREVHGKAIQDTRKILTYFFPDCENQCDALTDTYDLCWSIDFR